MRRSSPRRQPRTRILIVCEGEKTEVIYFTLFLGRLRATNVQLIVCGKECGSDPLSVVRYARQRMRSDNSIDQCYCVVDRDSHAEKNFSSAKVEAESENSRLRRGRVFDMVVSYPCIEFWFLLHYEYTRAPFVRQGNQSPGDRARKALEKHLPIYEKNSHLALSEIFTKTDVAIGNAEKALANANETGEANPSTRVHILIKELVGFLSSEKKEGA